MSSATSLLQDYPKLERWYQTLLAEPPSSHEPVRHFIFKTCYCMTLDTEKITEHWLNHLRYLREAVDDFATVLANIEASFASAAIPFFEIVAEFAEIAVKHSLGNEFAKEMQISADHSDATTFRFFAAWCYLNSNNFDACIDECEKIAHPYAPVYTIHGQALLESGRIHEAIQVLEIAIKIAPQEILAQFQLAKAYYIQCSFQQAWKCLEVCHQLEPQNAEIATMGALCCLNLDGAQLPQIQQSFQRLLKHLQQAPFDSETIKNLLDLALLLENPNLVAEIVDQADLSEATANPGFMQLLPHVLRYLHDSNNNATAARLLYKLAPSEDQVA